MCGFYVRRYFVFAFINNCVCCFTHSLGVQSEDDYRLIVEAFLDIRLRDYRRSGISFFFVVFFFFFAVAFVLF
jgi:hypothetical protein